MLRGTTKPLSSTALKPRVSCDKWNKTELHSAAGKQRLSRRRVSTLAGMELSTRNERQTPFNFPTVFENAPVPAFSFFPSVVKVARR